MGRLHLLEIHDQPWCPASLRDTLTDFLQFALNFGRSYRAVVPLLRNALARAGATRIVDLCSGAGGPWATLRREIAVPVLLTDKYPNRAAAGASVLPFHPEPVDALAVPPALGGFRTLFTSFHHFRPGEARAILADAVRQEQGIGVFEVTRRSPLTILLVALACLGVLVVAPFVRPFRWSRLAWTYLPPVMPFLGLFDGVVSCLRTYSPRELAALVAGLEEYDWEIGEVRGGWWPLPVTYLIGVPCRSGGVAAVRRPAARAGLAE